MDVRISDVTPQPPKRENPPQVKTPSTAQKIISTVNSNGSPTLKGRVKELERVEQLSKEIQGLEGEIDSIRETLDNLRGKQVAKRFGSYIASIIEAFYTAWNSNKIKTLINEKFISKLTQISTLTLEQRAILNKSRPNEVFFKQAIKDLRQISGLETPLLRQLMAVGLKGQKISDPYVLSRYKGMDAGFHVPFRAYSAIKFWEASKSKSMLGAITEPELNGISRISKHRANFSDYVQEMDQIGEGIQSDKNAGMKPSEVENRALKKKEKLIENIRANIDELDSTHYPNSNRVTVLEDGSTSFSIPGGWEADEGPGHFISYEIKKEKDGSYHFIIHNRGGGRDSRLYSSISFQDGVKTYAKTCIKIKVDPEAIKDKVFLSNLVEDSLRIKEKSNNLAFPPTFANDLIQDHLIKKSQGEIVISENEKLLKQLYLLHLDTEDEADKKAINQLAMEIIEEEPSFHSLQLWGSCVESNETGAEKDMAPKSTQKALKKFTIQELTKEVAKEYTSIKLPKKALKTDTIKAKLLKLEQEPHTPAEKQIKAIHYIFLQSQLKLKELSKKLKNKVKGDIEPTSKQSSEVLKQKVQALKNKFEAEFLSKSSEDLRRAYLDLTEKIKAVLGGMSMIKFKTSNDDEFIHHTPGLVEWLEQNIDRMIRVLTEKYPKDTKKAVRELNSYQKLFKELANAERLDSLDITQSKQLSRFFVELKKAPLDTRDEVLKVLKRCEEIKLSIGSIPKGALIWTKIRNEFQTLVNERGLPNDHPVTKEVEAIIAHADAQGAFSFNEE